MSDTIADITVSNTEYTDINTASGIAAGTAIVVSNKSLGTVLLQIAAGQPSADSKAGEILNSQPHGTSIKLITAGESTIWARATKLTSATLSVQDNS